MIAHQLVIINVVFQEIRWSIIASCQRLKRATRKTVNYSPSWSRSAHPKQWETSKSVMNSPHQRTLLLQPGSPYCYANFLNEPMPCSSRAADFVSKCRCECYPQARKDTYTAPPKGLSSKWRAGIFYSLQKLLFEIPDRFIHPPPFQKTWYIWIHRSH